MDRPMKNVDPSPNEREQMVHEGSRSSRREELIKKIENIFLKHAKCAVRGEPPSYLLKSRTTNRKECNFDERLSMEARNEITYEEIKFTTHEQRFTIISFILVKIHRLLLTESSMTIRELYDEKPELFGSPNAVDTALMDVCGLLEANVSELRVMSTSEGLPVVTAMKEVIDCAKPGGSYEKQADKGNEEVSFQLAELSISTGSGEDKEQPIQHLPIRADSLELVPGISNSHAGSVNGNGSHVGGDSSGENLHEATLATKKKKKKKTKRSNRF